MAHPSELARVRTLGENGASTPLPLSPLIPARDLGPARGRRYTQYSDSLRFSVIDKIVISPTRHTGPREGRGPRFFRFARQPTRSLSGVGVTGDEDFKGVSQKTPFAVPEL